MGNAALDVMNINREPKIIKHSDILSCIKQSISFSRVLHNLLKFSNTTIPMVPFVSCHKNRRHNIDMATGINFQRSIDDGNIHDNGHHLQPFRAKYHYISISFLSLEH